VISSWLGKSAALRDFLRVARPLAATSPSPARFDLSTGRSSAPWTVLVCVEPTLRGIANDVESISSIRIGWKSLPRRRALFLSLSLSLCLTMLVSYSLNYVMRATEINNLQFPTPALSGHEAGGSRTSCTERERERERGRECVQQPRLLQGRPVTMARVMIACPRLIISPPS